MSPDLVRKELRDRLSPTLSLGIWLALFCGLALSIYAGMKATLDELVSGYPPELLAVIGGAQGPGGYVVGEIFNLIAPLALVIYAIAAGARSVAGEEDGGTMGLLAAQPLTRLSILVSKATGLVSSLLAASMLFWVGVTTGSNVFGVGLASRDAAAASVHLFVLATSFGLVGLAAGAVTGSATRAAGITGGFAAAAYLAATTLPLAGFDRWAELSPWFYYNASQPLVNGIHPGHLLVLAAMAAVATVVAARVFTRRDLRG